MASDDNPLPQRSDTPVQDFQLVQALHLTRTSAADRDGDGWADLERSLGRVLDRLGTSHASEPYSEMGMDRIDRKSFALEPELTSRVLTALRALGDSPDDVHLERARSAVSDLEGQLG